MSSVRTYKIRNVKTEKVYTVDEKGLQAIKDKGWMNKYAVIGEHVLTEASRKSMIPDEIREAAGLGEPKKGRKRGEENG